MTDRPIIFSAPMVRALLDGRKTQTRRLLKLPTKTASGGPIYERPDMGGWAVTTHGGPGCFTVGKGGERLPVPERAGLWHQTTGACVAAPYAPGDRLYVREAHSAYLHREGVWYWADGNIAAYDAERPRPSIHMPRWASRLTLFVEDVRVQRLQEISEADAIAEGLVPAHEGYALTPAGECWGPTAAKAYRVLWNSLHGEDSWDANPWIVAVTFRVVHANIDTLDAEGF